MDKLTIASRASMSGKKFFKSYVKNIRVAEIRDIGHVAGWVEADYFFTYKGNEYRVNQYFVPNDNGIKKFSAGCIYRLEEVR